ncbi:hypothetical protein [Kocuria sp.]|uniref:hypothetical protein n=1 Tax=Kocuria sp. TaxID=1871328 RepID=UPI0026DB1B25|nr:hypothetical protein [Kocuria sp.]MDO4919024.1 hypothetical protein [Kocuria sp.]
MPGTERTGGDQTARERTLGMTPEQEREYLADDLTQPQPADGGIGAMTDMQDREPDTSN